jgi:hypothetical protein
MSLGGATVVFHYFPYISSTREFVKAFLDEPLHFYPIYLMVMLAGFPLTWLTDPFLTVEGSRVTYKLWYIGYFELALILAAVFPLNLLSFYFREHREEMEKGYIKLITYGWILFGGALTLGYILDYVLANKTIKLLIYLFDILPLAMMAYAFRDPGLLASILFEVKERREIPEIKKSFGKTVLIEYTPRDALEEVIEDIIDSYVDRGRNVVLISSQPKTNFYHIKFRRYIEEDKVMKLIDLSRRVEFSIGKIIEISMHKLEYFSIGFEKLPKESVVILESLTPLILSVGFTKAYNFILNAAETLPNKGIDFVALLNREAHDKKEISIIEDLFISLKRICSGELRDIKGNGRAILKFSKPFSIREDDI